jgi:hypothetical protein
MFRRPLLLVIVVLVCLVAVGLLVMAAFPPTVTPSAVERTIPNDRFNTR